MSHAKTAELTEMPFGKGGADPNDCALDGGGLIFVPHGEYN